MKITGKVIKVYNPTLDGRWHKDMPIEYIFFANQYGWLQDPIVDGYFLFAQSAMVELLHSQEEKELIWMLHPELVGNSV